ncbi:Centromere and Transposable Element-Derived Protein [Pleurotus pulmonarius]
MTWTWRNHRNPTFLISDAQLMRKSAVTAARDFDVPNSTLQGRFAGRLAKKDAHEGQKHFSKSQELTIIDWISTCGKRGIPITQPALQAFASDFLGHPVGENCPRRFIRRHPELKTNLTQPLEACRANALNRASVDRYFDTLEEVIQEYKVRHENIYNMDEKGLVLGATSRSLAIIDRDQSTVYEIGDGSRELVTAIECISAAGIALRPTIIFKAQKHNLEWGRNNPGGASVAISPNGWTDQELGAEWLENDFEPQTAAFLENKDEYRLLILDGHNSHCTFWFCRFARDHKIIVICLPPHTTHALQPCDVVVFAALQRAWKAQVKIAKKVHKSNFLQTYHAARTAAMKVSTIISAFYATGIYPLNRCIIPEAKFAPALNTTTQSAPLFPSPPDIIPIPNSDTPPDQFPIGNNEVEPLPLPRYSHQSVQTDISVLNNNTMYIGPPLKLPHNASKEQFIRQNDEFRRVNKALYDQVQVDCIQLHLSNLENDRLRQLLFKPQPKRTNDTSDARHLTSDQQLERLAEIEKEVEDKEREKVERQQEREKKQQEKKKRDADKAAEKLVKEQRRQAAAERKELDTLLGAVMMSLVAEEKRLLPPPRQPQKRKVIQPDSSDGEEFHLTDADDEATPVPAPSSPPVAPRSRPRPRPLARPLAPQLPPDELQDAVETHTHPTHIPLENPIEDQPLHATEASPRPAPKRRRYIRSNHALTPSDRASLTVTPPAHTQPGFSGAGITAEASQALNKEPGLASIVPPPIPTPSEPARRVTRSRARVLGL